MIKFLIGLIEEANVSLFLLLQKGYNNRIF